ncbi:hypothetical protein QR680_002832 [Steinernema hermaphroditum]|uniref:Uncharacterized protein n=1 Tax=Steinernema hermaphroditum TaxID=289476 RepID=A0AA39H493_9BILA|nr:hypothetical protein QR680_002832 [Steinernema hermaphroditum]
MRGSDETSKQRRTQYAIEQSNNIENVPMLRHIEIGDITKRIPEHTNGCMVQQRGVDETLVLWIPRPSR